MTKPHHIPIWFTSTHQTVQRVVSALSHITKQLPFCEAAVNPLSGSSAAAAHVNKQICNTSAMYSKAIAVHKMQHISAMNGKAIAVRVLNTDCWCPADTTAVVVAPAGATAATLTRSVHTSLTVCSEYEGEKKHACNLILLAQFGGGHCTAPVSGPAAVGH